MSFWVVALAAAQLACPPGGDPTQVSRRPDWMRTPTAEDMEEAYPPAAAEQNLAGRAVLSCDVTIEGDAVACKVEEEAPAGYGFGEAAITVSRLFKFRPASTCGVPRVSQVTVPIIFQAPEPPPPGPPPSAQAMALARRLLEAQGYAEGTIMGRLRSELYMERGQTPLNADERMAFERASAATWSEGRNAILDAAAEPIARRMTPAELQVAIDFYDGPVGRKLWSDGDMHYDMTTSIGQTTLKFYGRFREHYCQALPTCGLDLGVAKVTPGR